ncbi:cytochrome c oxidase assembly protein [Rhodoferax sp.]|uniref:cytochrome c oxidase assembly protein n=1 Tax=Rhodoferax sp. TaxID=50421 RepID=UPI00283CC51F|nr:cytochrome c oxidase assembly protein [Rhodoferax sp.]MDR3371163.1 cytochrome c oxidase assembly protein [Rhodoferax sp.]
MQQQRKNLLLVVKLSLITLVMFAFGYGLVPIYKTFCDLTGINKLSVEDRALGLGEGTVPANTQVDMTRTITVEFDANSRGPWKFKPEQRSLQVHPGELATAVYEFQNVQSRRITARAVPSYAPQQAAAHFTKLECFCFQEQTLDPGEKKTWPVVFVVDAGLSQDVQTITLSYTFYEIGAKTPSAPVANANKHLAGAGA